MKNFQNKLVDKEAKPDTEKFPLVTDYMTRDLITFEIDTPIDVVIKSLLENRISGAPILNNDGKVVGLIDDKDCLNTLVGISYNQLPTTKNTAADYMSNVMKTISENLSILQVAHVFVSTPYKRLLVMDENEMLVGSISRRDVLRAIDELV